MMATEEVERTWMVAHVLGRDADGLDRTEFIAATRDQLAALLDSPALADELLEAGSLGGAEWLVIS